MRLPAVAHDDGFGVGGRGAEVPKVHARVEEPEDEQEAADGTEDDADDGARGGAAVDRAIGRGDDGGVVLPGEELVDDVRGSWRQLLSLNR